EDVKMSDTEEFKVWYEKWHERLKRQPESKSSVMQLMRSCNPAVIPRNHRVEEALEAAVEKGDYSVMNKLLYVLSRPFAYVEEQEEYAKLPKASKEAYRTFCGTHNIGAVALADQNPLATAPFFAL